MHKASHSNRHTAQWKFKANNKSINLNLNFFWLYLQVFHCIKRLVVRMLLWGQCTSTARRTFFSSWSAVGRMSGSESSMSISSSHIAGFGGGGSGGARRALMGMINCRSGFWHRASPNGMSQRPRITYAPTTPNKQETDVMVNQFPSILWNRSFIHSCLRSFLWSPNWCIWICTIHYGSTTLKSSNKNNPVHFFKGQAWYKLIIIHKTSRQTHHTERLMGGRMLIALI